MNICSHVASRLMLSSCIFGLGRKRPQQHTVGPSSAHRTFRHIYATVRESLLHLIVHNSHAASVIVNVYMCIAQYTSTYVPRKFLDDFHLPRVFHPSTALRLLLPSSSTRNVDKQQKKKGVKLFSYSRRAGASPLENRTRYFCL